MSGGLGGVGRGRRADAGGVEEVKSPGAAGRTDAGGQAAKPKGGVRPDAAARKGSKQSHELLLQARALEKVDKAAKATRAAKAPKAADAAKPAEAAGAGSTTPAPKGRDFSTWNTTSIRMPSPDASSWGVYGESELDFWVEYDNKPGSARFGQFLVYEFEPSKRRPMTAEERASFRKAMEREIEPLAREGDALKHHPRIKLERLRTIVARLKEIDAASSPPNG